jgi:GNAT superfamily N-acetyltransferase
MVAVPGLPLGVAGHRPLTTTRARFDEVDRAVGVDDLVFNYRLQERVALTREPDYQHLERWTVSVVLGDGTGQPAEDVGYVHVIVINLEAGRDIIDLIDRASGQWVDAAGADHATTSPERGQEQASGDVGPVQASHTLLLDRVWVEPRYRGHGFGPLIAAVVLSRLGRGCHMVACYPAPFVGERRPEDRDREIQALCRIWAKVGFVHFGGGVWTLDLQVTDLQATVRRLQTP